MIAETPSVRGVCVSVFAMYENRYAVSAAGHLDMVEDMVELKLLGTLYLKLAPHSLPPHLPTYPPPLPPCSHHHPFYNASHNARNRALKYRVLLSIIALQTFKYNLARARFWRFVKSKIQTAHTIYIII